LSFPLKLSLTHQICPNKRINIINNQAFNRQLSAALFGEAPPASQPAFGGNQLPDPSLAAQRRLLSIFHPN
jgi:hypothetical protein